MYTLKGISLISLLALLAIVAIIAALAIPACAVHLDKIAGWEAGDDENQNDTWWIGPPKAGRPQLQTSSGLYGPYRHI